ncbi:MAG: 16S rRNA (guanine(527)-N(7))-methyltransferase RsmG [Ruminococcaceae bacterium]|nr:16S rRNA (guanine(527)-N(7))-methyltransferase RsmG [Oscillospiraceae bacterium]
MYDILKEGFDALEIDVNNEKIEQLITYAHELVEWNEKINLTAICDDFGIATKHFLDSATPLLTQYVTGKVIDVGTGAGFPGLVLKILKPEIELTLLDSLNKRINFLKDVSKKIGTEAEFVHARAEDGGRTHRAKYDTVVSRAVANMTVLSELCLPFLKVGGYFLALKGPLADEELEDAKKAIYVLGGEVIDVFSAKIPHTDLNHKIIIVKKVRQTPQQYPRKAGIVTKNPIGNCYNIKKKPTK